MSDFKDYLQEQRAVAWEQGKALLDNAAAEKRDLTAEEEQSWQRINADIDALDERRKDIEAAEKRAIESDEAFARIGGRTPGASAPNKRDEFRSFLAGETREFAITANPNEQLRDLTKGSATAGGNTVPTSFYGMLWEHLIENAAIAGVSTVLNTTSGENFEVPVTTTHSTAALIGEASSITESDPAFAKRTLGAYKYATAFQVASELLNDTGVNLEEYFARRAGQAVGNAFGVDLAVGNGSSKPSGIAQTSTLGVTGAASVAGVPNGDNLIDLFYSVIAPYRNSSKCGWLMRDTTAGTIRKIKDSSGGAGVGNYLWTPGLAGSPDTILGKPVIIEPNIAATGLSAKSVLFGDLGAYITRIAGGIRFERSDEFAFGTDQVSFRCIVRGDGILGDQSGAVKHFIGNAA